VSGDCKFLTSGSAVIGTQRSAFVSTSQGLAFLNIVKKKLFANFCVLFQI